MSRYVISGFGRMGQIHKKVADSQGWACVAIADPRLKKSASNPLFTRTEVLNNIQDLGDDVEFDTVIFASTTPSRVSGIEWALNHPNQPLIITEKPFASSVVEARRLRDLAFSSDRPVLVNHQRRFHPIYEALLTKVRTNELGGLASIHVLGSNFGLGNVVTHFLELAALLFDTRPSYVSAWLDEDPVPSPRGGEFSDTSGSILVEFGPNQRMFIDFRQVLGHGQTVVFGFEQGQVVISEKMKTFFVDSRNPEEFFLSSYQRVKGKDVQTFSFEEEGFENSLARLYSSDISTEWRSGLDRAVWAVEVATASHVSHRYGGGSRVSCVDLPANVLGEVFPWA